MKLWKFLIVLGIVGAVAAVLVAGINFLVLPSLVHSNEVVAVPDLRGASPQAAADLLRPLDLEVVVSRTSAHAVMGAGLIIEQVPAPQAGIRKGRVVKVVVSSGPATTALPDLVGVSERQAGITLQRDSFQLGRVTRMQKPGLSEPQVAAQHPRAGTKLLRGAVVDLVIAEPAPATAFLMPDLRGVPLFKARQALEAVGLLMGEVDLKRQRGHDDDDADGDVNAILEQHPPAGARVVKGEVVDVVVSSR